MFQIIKFNSFFNAKTTVVFALAFSMGLISDSIFGRYIFRYQIVETFTQTEAEAKLNKRITVGCFDSSELGTITSYHRGDDGQISVTIKWDKPILGKFDKLDFGKETYQQCVTETNIN